LPEEVGSPCFLLVIGMFYQKVYGTRYLDRSEGWEDIFTGHTVPPTTKGEYKQKLAASDAKCTVMHAFVNYIIFNESCGNCVVF